MNDLVPRRNARELAQQSYDISSPRLPARVQRAIDREAAWGLTQAARAQAAAFVADARVEAAEVVVERTMLGLDRLHRVEAAMAKNDPIQAARYDGLVEDFLLVARSEICRLPKEF